MNDVFTVIGLVSVLLMVFVWGWTNGVKSGIKYMVKKHSKYFDTLDTTSKGEKV